MSEAAILSMLAAMDARQARIEAMLQQIVEAKEDPTERDLVQLVANLTAGEGFWAGELWTTVEQMRTAAAASGEPLPDIARAFDDLGLVSAKSLGRWLAAQDAAVIDRSVKTRDGVQWRVTLAG